MSWLSDAFDFVGKYSKEISTAGNIVGTGFDIYSGITQSNQADKYYGLYEDSMKNMDDYNKALAARELEAYDRYKQNWWDYEDATAKYAMEDLEANRPLLEQMRLLNSQQLDYNSAQLSFASRVLGDTSDRYGKITPIIDEAEVTLLNKLNESEETLRERYGSESLNNIRNEYASSNEEMMQQMAQLGVNPSSGYMASMLRQNSADQGLDEATALTSAYRLAENDHLNRLAAAQQYRINPSFNLPQYSMPTTDAQSYQSGKSTIAGINMTPNWGQSVTGWNSAANTYAQGAQQAYTGAQYNLQNLYDIYNPNKKDN